MKTLTAKQIKKNQAEMKRKHEEATAKLKTLTQEQKNLIGGAAQAVWQECAYDILQATQESENRSWVSQAVVIEVSADAGRLEELLRRDYLCESAAGSRRAPTFTTDKSNGGVG